MAQKFDSILTKSRRSEHAAEREVCARATVAVDALVAVDGRCSQLASLGSRDVEHEWSNNFINT